jgi:hypothetical protein
MLRMPLGKADGLAASAAEEVELGSAYLRASDGYNVNNVRGVKREHTLDTLVANHSANGEHLIGAAAPAGNYHTGKHLNTGFSAFNDLAMHFYSVAYLEVRHFLL